MYRQKPVKIGVGIGAFGALYPLLMTILLFGVPRELMSSSARTAYVETWSQPIMTVGGFVFTVGIPLSCAAIAYYLTTREHTPGRVIMGFLIGGIVLIIGDAVLGVAVTNRFVSGTGVERSLLGQMQNNLPQGRRLFVGGLLGVAAALVVEEYF